eukprot:UN29589
MKARGIMPSKTTNVAYTFAMVGLKNASNIPKTPGGTPGGSATHSPATTPKFCPTTPDIARINTLDNSEIRNLDLAIKNLEKLSIDNDFLDPAVPFEDITRLRRSSVGDVSTRILPPRSTPTRRHRSVVMSKRSPSATGDILIDTEFERERKRAHSDTGQEDSKDSNSLSVPGTYDKIDPSLEKLDLSSINTLNNLDKIDVSQRDDSFSTSISRSSNNKQLDLESELEITIKPVKINWKSLLIDNTIICEKCKALLSDYHTMAGWVSNEKTNK